MLVIKTCGSRIWISQALPDSRFQILDPRITSEAILMGWEALGFKLRRAPVRIFLEKVPIMATLFLGAEDDFPIDRYSILAHLLQNHHWLRQVAHHGARHLCHQGLLQCPSLFINYMGDLSLHKLETFVVYSWLGIRVAKTWQPCQPVGAIFFSWC